MLVLHGTPISNYYNKVKLALLEKGVTFEEAFTGTKSTDEAVLAASPLAKIPFIRTDRGTLCESQVILEWLEDAFPQAPLLPADPHERAKVRELVTFLDWHLEMAARQLYGTAFFGGAPLSEANAARIRNEVTGRIEGLKRLVKFAPYAAGDRFTMADCSAYVHLPLVAMATKAIYGEDLLAAAGVDHRAYVKFIGERPGAQKVSADRKAAQSRL